MKENQSPDCTVTAAFRHDTGVQFRSRLGSTDFINIHVHHPVFMSPRNRRILQAVLYEVFAVAFVGPVLALAFDKPATSALGLAIALSSIALVWNYVFNAIFERWEARQIVKGRSFSRRLAHGTGFEGGLVFLLIPVMSFWLDISLLDAFFTNLGLLAFFFFYAIGFTWAFDRVFGLPQSVTKDTKA